MSIQYIDNVKQLSPEQLTGFFVGWPNPPSPEVHLKLLLQSDKVIVALDITTNQVVGFITAITDGVLSAYIPLLEVLPNYKRQGIGTELTRLLIDRLRSLYMIDLMCDPEIQHFYERLGLRPSTGMSLRNYDKQAG